MDIEKLVGKAQQESSEKINLDKQNAAKGLAKLVLAILNLIRELMENQAMRRIESDALSDDQIEEIGATLMTLEEKFEELREIFGLTPEDLEINLNNIIDLE